MAMTVTATQGGSTGNGLLLRVFVLTGAKTAASQTGASTNNQFASVTTFAQSITTSAGSNVYGAASHGSGTTDTGSNATIVDSLDDSTNGWHYDTFKALNVTAAATTRGFTLSPTAQSGPFAQLEVLAAGTLAEDASAPAVASTLTAITVTTASFTPPAGSLLVALVGSNGGATVTTMTVSGGSLSWSEKVKNNPSGGDYAGVWIAQVPAATAPSGILAQAAYAPPAAPRQILPQVITGPVAAPGVANAGLAAGTAAALDATVSIVGSPNAGLASGAATALDASVAIAANAGVATGTAEALQPSVSAIGTTGLPIVQSTTAAFPVPAPVAPQVIPATQIPAFTVSAGLAAATAAAQPPSAAITANAGLATGTGAALQPVVSTSGSTNATAGLATGTGDAKAPAVAVTANAGLATGSGAALAPGHGAGIQLATATAAAQSASLAVMAQASAATALAVAFDIPLITANATSSPAATDPRDGTPAVTVAATSTSAVSDG